MENSDTNAYQLKYSEEQHAELASADSWNKILHEYKHNHDYTPNSKTPPNFSQRHKDVDTIVSQRMLLLGGTVLMVLGAFFSPMLFMLFEWCDFNSKLCLAFGNAIYFVFAGWFFYEAYQSRNRCLHASWVYATQKPVIVDAMHQMADVGSEGHCYVNRFILAGEKPQVVQAFVITEHEKQLVTSSWRESSSPGEVKLKVWFDPFSHNAIVAEDPEGKRYWFKRFGKYVSD